METEAAGMRVALAAHDEVLHNAIEPHGYLRAGRTHTLSGVVRFVRSRRRR